MDASTWLHRMSYVMYNVRLMEQRQDRRQRRAKQFEATVHGRVQGVSFRYYTRREAQRLGVMGWVANQRDGSVRVLAQGPEEVLDRFIDFLHHGPPAALVKKVDVTWIEPSETFSQFSIRWL
jgi:acylphosphatase